MKYFKTIQLFEHDQLRIDSQGFTKSHWEALGYFNEKHGGNYFRLIPRGVHFSQFVGVIQVGNLNIEILPKISREVKAGDKQKWQQVLIEILRECRWLQVDAPEKATLRYKPNSILEAYIELFLLKCEEIVRQGLVKKYRTIDQNSGALKGRLLVDRQVSTNLVHQERFYIRHQTYDGDNLYNRILLKALKLIPSISNSPAIADRAAGLLLFFPEMGDVRVDYLTFENLSYDRKTHRYKEAMEIAAMLLLNYRPDISTGKNHVLAILFDMNKLWEEYIFRQMFKHKPPGWSVMAQNSRKFWQPVIPGPLKTIRPDIVIHNKANDRKVVLDTKWKIPENFIPDDADLKQMFVYNEYWGSENSILIYPDASFSDTPVFRKGVFHAKDSPGLTHQCGLMHLSVLDSTNNSLDRSIGKRMNEFLEKSVLSDEV